MVNQWQGVPLCVHYEFGLCYAGSARFEAGEDVHIDMTVPHAGTYTLGIELPQARALPLWFSAYVWACPGYTLQGTTLSCTRTVAAGGDRITWRLPIRGWTVELPCVPGVVSLETLCGKLPLHFFVSLGREEYARFVLQRRQHCVQLRH